MESCVKKNWVRRLCKADGGIMKLQQPRIRYDWNHTDDRTTSAFSRGGYEFPGTISKLISARGDKAPLTAA
jgi:hypothetical protein